MEVVVVVMLCVMKGDGSLYVFRVLLVSGYGARICLSFWVGSYIFDLLLLGFWIDSSSFCFLCLACIDGIRVYNAEFLV